MLRRGIGGAIKLHSRECRFPDTFGDAEHFVLAHDQVFLAVKLDFGPGVLTEENVIANFHVEWKRFPIVGYSAAADRNDCGLLRFLLRGVGDDDPPDALARPLPRV